MSYAFKGHILFAVNARDKRFYHFTTKRAYFTTKFTMIRFSML